MEPELNHRRQLGVAGVGEAAEDARYRPSCRKGLLRMLL